MEQIRRYLAWIVFIVVAGWLGGCQTSTAPPLPLEVRSSGRLFVGTIISGPVEGVPEIVSPDIAQVQVRWVALEQVPEDLLDPIHAHSRLIIAPDSGTALPVSGRLTRLVRFGSGESAAEFVNRLEADDLGLSSELVTDTRQIVPGATLQLGIGPLGTALDSEPRITLFVSLYQSGEAATQPSALNAMVGVQVAGPAPSDEPVAALWRSRETAVIDSVDVGDGRPFVVVVPIESPRTPWSAIAAIATIARAPVEASVAEALQAELEQASERAKAGLELSPLGDAPALGSAVAALQHPESIQPALLFLTSLSNARIAGDMVLVADEAQLQWLAERTASFVQPDAVPPMADLQWFLDRSALQVMCQAAEEGTLSAELQSVLSLHTGEVARRPDAILALLEQVGSSDVLMDRLITENFIALEDSSPAARVRAYDWLIARNRAPADFDPLADARSRRAAIDKAMNQLEGQP